jgi:Ca2+-binding RTX toxin-like protein
MGTWSPGPGPTSGNDTFTGDGTGETANGGDGNDTLNGNGGNDTLTGGAGDDHINAGDGDDTVDPGDDYIDDLITGGSGTDTLDLSAWAEDGVVATDSNIYRGVGPGESDFVSGFEILRGTQVNDHIVSLIPAQVYGMDGDDWLVSFGSVTMTGGVGRDVFSAATNATNNIVADFQVGVDYFAHAIQSTSVSGGDTLLTFSGYILRIVGVTGLSLAQWQAHQLGSTQRELNSPSVDNLTGTSGADWFYLGGGNDTANGADGGDMISGGVGIDTINGGAGEDRLEGGSGNDTINGGANNDQIKGDSGDDTLLGGAGADALNGGAGADLASYSDSTIGVTIDLGNPAANTGDGVGDTYTGIEGILGSAHADTLRGDGANNRLRGGLSADILEGRGGNDTLEGGSGNDTHDGGLGADAMTGGAGDDIYLVDDVGDVVSEFGIDGNDSVYTSISYTLTNDVEVLAALGAISINLQGNTLNNLIVGNAAQNTMDGGVGADTLIGGAGDDLYVIDNQLDVIIEVAGEGALDTIYTAFTYYQMGANVENTQITGGPGSYVVGNDVNNLLVGNTGADTLVGGIGADTLVGAAGDDFYIIADQDDVIIELAAGGNDTILTSISYYQMGAEVENLEMTGTTGTYAIGNALDNLIVGNLGADTLDGGLGGDFMVGHEGDDLYFVDDLGDRSVESANEGVDAIYTSINWTTGAHIENLVLTGTANLAGGGNELNNFIFGNDGDNAITGALGQDVLTGGAGADTFVYASAAEGGDAITDFVSGVDRFSISAVGFGGGLVGGGAAALVAGSDPTSLTASFLYDTDDGALYWDSDGAGGASAILIATLSGAPALTQSDIIIGP